MIGMVRIMIKINEDLEKSLLDEARKYSILANVGGLIKYYYYSCGSCRCSKCKYPPSNCMVDLYNYVLDRFNGEQYDYPG
jgi:hypothetical protein